MMKTYENDKEVKASMLNVDLNFKRVNRGEIPVFNYPTPPEMT